MNDYFLELFTKYKKKGILVDTNILLLFVVGSLSPDLIKRISRTAHFSIQDFQIISKVIDFFDVRITTPHILTEVGNLIGNRNDIRNALRSYIEIVEERFSESVKIVSDDAFSKFGLTDTAVLDLSKNSCIVLTNDGPLYGLLVSKGVDVVSLALLRQAVS